MMTEFTLEKKLEIRSADRTLKEKKMKATWHTLAEFHLPSEPGNEKIAMEKVASLVEPMQVSDTLLERIKTSVAEATMNALEHGNRYQADIPVFIRVEASKTKIRVQVEDQGRGPKRAIPETPDLEAKLAGLQTPRGWGLFLIQNMVDELHVTTGKGFHRLELIFNIIENIPE